MTKQGFVASRSARVAAVAVLALALVAVALPAAGCGSGAADGESDTTVDSAFDQAVALYPAATSAGNYGFIDKNGALAIPAKYAEAAAFSGGLAAVRLEVFGRWGYIDQTGKMVIEPQFADASGFSEGLAPVRVDANGSWGFADTTGALVIAPQFADAASFSEGLARVREGEETGYVDTGGKWVIRLADQEAVGEFSGGLALVYERVTDLYGFIDKDGGVAITPAYADAWSFSEGVAVASLPGGSTEAPEGGLYGYMDKDGDWVVQPQFADARPFREGLAAAQSASDGSWGYVDITGETVIDGQWDEAGPFSEGIARVALVVGDTEAGDLLYGYAYVDMDGKIVWQDQVFADFRAGRTTTTINDAGVTGPVGGATNTSGQ